MTLLKPISYDIPIITKYLEEKEIDFNLPLFFTNMNNKSLLLNIFTYLCLNGTKEIVNLFIQHGANVNNLAGNIFPIQLAICKLNKGTIEALIDAGANISKIPFALYYSIKATSYSCTKFFLEKGFNPNYIEKNKFSALYYAVNNKFEIGVRLLLEYSAKVDESVMQLVESNYDNVIIKKLITDSVQVQSRKRLREPSPEVIKKRPSISTQKDIDTLFADAPLLSDEDKDVIVKFFTTPCVYPRTTPQRRMKLREIVTPQGIENFFLILRFEDMTYQQTHKFVKNIETKKVIDLTHL
jgi:ankyrin repeat protein